MSDTNMFERLTPELISQARALAIKLGTDVEKGEYYWCPNPVKPFWVVVSTRNADMVKLMVQRGKAGIPGPRLQVFAVDDAEDDFVGWDTDVSVTELEAAVTGALAKAN